MIDIYLLLIALMVVYVYDLTDFSQSMLKVLWNYAYKNKPFPEDLRWTDIHPLLKPLECSLCAVWWITLIVSICCGWWSLPVMAYCMFLSFMTPVFNNILLFFREFILKCINTLADYFDL